MQFIRSTAVPSIPPQRLLRAQLLQPFYSIRSERVLMEQLDYNILFRWFVGPVSLLPVASVLVSPYQVATPPCCERAPR